MWGNSPIITTVFQILLNRIDLGMTLPEAVAAPRASQRNTATVQAEPALLASPEAAGLMALRHVFASPATPEIGAATGAELLPDGQVVAVAEPVRRGGGSAAVVTPSQLGTGQRPYGVRLLPERDQMVSAPLGS